MVDERVVRELVEARAMLAALSGLPDEATPLEHGRAIAERLHEASLVVKHADDVLTVGGR